MSDAPVISAFNWAPDFARGRVRDLRVRWALEEIGQAYDTHLINASRPRGPDYVRWQPFDQVPAYREGDLEMFESGAILLRLGESDERLLPREERARWQAVSWTFAALNSVEPFLAMPMVFSLFHADQPWSRDAVEATKPLARRRLQRLADALGEREWLAGPFSIADIAMVTVFSVDACKLVEEQPALVAYRDRGKARPAYARAIEAQLNDFTAEPLPKMEGA